MTRIIAGQQIKHAIAEVAPNRIAVAYLGTGGIKYIEPKRLKEIVVAPVPGTDPHEIAYLARNFLGWDKVHLLDSLHAKIYLGETSAAFGSFNLSQKGMSGSGNFEAGVMTEDPAMLAELSHLFEHYKAAAGDLSTNEKMRKLEKLMLENNVLQANADPASEKGLSGLSTHRSLADFEPISDRDFYCCSYSLYSDITLDDSAFEESMAAVQDSRTSETTKLDQLAEGYLAFSEDEEIEPNRWVMTWATDEKGCIDPDKGLSWMYVHVVQPYGTRTSVDGIYSKVALQWRKEIKRTPPKPFEPDELAMRALKNVIGTGNFRCFEFDEGTNFKLRDTFPFFKNFIQALKREYIRLGGKSMREHNEDVPTVT